MATEVQFLMDQSDTMLAYEKRGLEAPFGQHPLMALIGSMDRVQQLEVIYGEDGKGRKEGIKLVFFLHCSHVNFNKMELERLEVH